VLELRHVRSFLVLADELHFGRAAARLHLAQSSLSEHVQRLERELGVTLVHRTSRQVVLTASGSAFRVEATRLLEQAATAREAARAAAGEATGTLSIGFNFPAGHALLPPALAALSATHPQVLTRLWERRSGPQLRALLDGTLDVAFVYGPCTDPAIDSAALSTVPVVAVVGADVHPLAGQTSVTMCELADQRCVLFGRPQSPAMHDAITGAARAAGVTLTIDDEIDDPAATGIIVATRAVVAFASAPRATAAAANGLVALPINDPVPELAIHLAWRRGSTAPLVQSFRTIVTDRWPQEGAARWP
jgi:DNA-binding transcriptional LysR family regulator